MTPLQITYEDESLIAINKPPGLLVHRTRIAIDATEFAVQSLRNQINQHVYPVHRLDRKTGGVLLFAKNNEMNATMQKMFSERQIDKSYLAIVRGHITKTGEIDYPLKDSRGIERSAITFFSCLNQCEIPYRSSDKHERSRYSLVRLIPKTGRMHQLRRHMAHVFHPIIGDRPHGCNKQNRFFKHKFDMIQMLLHAEKLSFKHPISGVEINIIAKPGEEFLRMLATLGFPMPEIQ